MTQDSQYVWYVGYGSNLEKQYTLLPFGKKE